MAPGLVDIQVHFREPGREEAETIETGARAAALGGFTAVVAMPNTTPPLDDAKVVERGARAGPARDVPRDRGRLHHARPRGARSSRRSASSTTSAYGCSPTTATAWPTPNVMRRAFEYATALPGAVISQHAEDPALVAGGHMHEGEWSAKLGIPGRPAAAEITIVARDLELARITGGRYHVLHMSTAGATDLVRAAKAAGVRVTAEASPQHFTLTDAECASFDPVFKMNPPLRSDADVEGILAGLVDGTIDAIATDHAPHPPATKELPFEEAPPGMLGVETALAVTITRLVETGKLSLRDALARLSLAARTHRRARRRRARAAGRAPATRRTSA